MKPLESRTTHSSLDTKTNIDGWTLADIIDCQAVQAMMEDFYRLTNIGCSLVDNAGRLLASVGSQDVRAQFHRTDQDVLEPHMGSDATLFRGILKGVGETCLCQNNIRSMVTPIEIDGRHLGSIRLEQFFYDDDDLDFTLFRHHARLYGLNETEYLAALERIPRQNRESVERAMAFYAKLAGRIATQGYASFKLARALSQKDVALCQLAESEEQQRAILQTAMDGFLMADTQGRLLDANDAYCRMSGYNLWELLSMTLADLEVSESREDTSPGLRKIQDQGHCRFETRHRRKDGTVFDVEVSTQYQPVEGGRMVAFLRDITEHKKQEEERELTARLILMVNTSDSLREGISDLIAALQRWSGCEAVGIRLGDGEDYPYYETRGFSNTFLEAENSLCAYGPDGEILRDGEGNPVLECMCGNILCGRFNPDKPFFTAYGSFWTNNTTALLASTTETDRQARTRNRCNGEGYESVALIPLRHDKHVFGLLQFNDHRKNRFTPEEISSFERVIHILAIAFSRRLAEDALRQKESTLQLITDHMPGYIAYVDSNLRYRFVNKAYEEFYQKSREEIIGGLIQDLPGPICFGWPNEKIQAVLAGRRAQFESCIPRNRSQLYFTVDLIPGMEKTEPPQGFYVLIREITERKQAENRNRRNEARLRSIVNILQYQADNKQDFLDHALEEAVKLTESRFGYIYFYDEDREEFTLNTWSKETVKECRIPNRQVCLKLGKIGILGEVIRRRNPFILNDFQADHSLKNGYPEGHVHLTSFMAVPVLKDGRILAVVGLANKVDAYDQTDVLQVTLLMDAVWKSMDIKNGEDQLLESKSRIEGVLSSLNDAVLLVDPDTRRIVDCNSAAMKLFGYAREELMDRETAFLHVDQAHFELFGSEAMKAYTSPGYYETEFSMRRRDGTIFPTEHFVRPMRDCSGRVTHVVSVVRDISDRKRAEEEKADLEIQLQKVQKMEAIGTLAGGIAHDFNNILSPIIGRCEMVLDDLEDDSSLKPQIHGILSSALRASDLVRQILAFSRQAEAGKSPVLLQEIIEEVIPLIRHAIPSTIDVTLSVDESCYAVLADAGQIHQVLMNLVTNAYQAMENSGGQLEVGLREIQVIPGSLSNIGLLPGRYVDLYVADTGMGMDENILRRIFDPYFTTKEPGKGTGLGLAISYGIVKKHGGQIHVSSRPGEGAVFHVYLPVMKTWCVDEEQAPQVSDRGGTEHILLVDDEFEIVETIVPMLERLGYKVTARTGSIDALAAFKNDPDRFALLITDMTMPNLTGIQLAGQVHKIRPGFPIILCTGFSHQVNEDNIGMLGINALAMKPIVREQLTALVRTVLDNPETVKSNRYPMQ